MSELVMRCPECGVPLELGHDCLAGDARLASEDARERFDRREAPDLKPNEYLAIRGRVYRVAGFNAYGQAMLSEDHSRAALPSPSGPDAETLAATVHAFLYASKASPRILAALSGLVALAEQRGEDFVRAGTDAKTLALAKRVIADNGPADRSDEGKLARAVVGLVALVEQLTEQSTERLWRLNNAEALVEQRERERDDAQRVLEIAAKKAHEELDRRVAAEALLARHRQALEEIAASEADTWHVHTARAALAASAPGTEEPA